MEIRATSTDGSVMLRKPSISIQPVMISPPVLLVVLVIEQQQCAFLLYGLEIPDPFDQPIPDCQICEKRVPGFCPRDI